MFDKVKDKPCSAPAAGAATLLWLAAGDDGRYFDQNETGEMTKKSNAAHSPQRASAATAPWSEQHHASGSFRDLVTMRMIALFSLLRRGGTLAQRRQFDLSELEWRVMVNVAFSPQSLTGLADVLVLDRGQLSRGIKAMAQRGLVTRERKPGGPEIVIKLSKEGEALHERMIEWAVDRDTALTSGLSPDDIATLRRVLAHMIEKARVRLEEERNLESAPRNGDAQA